MYTVLLDKAFNGFVKLESIGDSVFMDWLKIRLKAYIFE